MDSETQLLDRKQSVFYKTTDWMAGQGGPSAGRRIRTGLRSDNFFGKDRLNGSAKVIQRSRFNFM